MFPDLLFYVLVPVLLAWITIQFLLNLWKNSSASKVQISICEKPSVLANQLTIYYKYCVNPSKNSQAIVDELAGILPKKNLRLIKIHYDDPKVVKSEHCQSAIGCIYKVNNDELFEENFALQLTRWGFEKMVLPRSGKAIYARKPQDTTFMLSTLLDNLSICSERVNEFAKQMSLKAPVFVYTNELVDGVDYLDIFKPLDNYNEFIVPEYKSIYELESKLARRKFDSDESDSQSEASLLEEGESTHDEDEIEEKSS